MATLESYKWPSKLGGNRLTRRVLFTGAIARSLKAQQPETSGFDLSLLDEDMVPNELFFVREHFPQPPGLTPGGWRLNVQGAVAEPIELSFEQLSGMPSSKRLPVTLECAENPVDGGLVSHAEWSGCPLATVLEKARVKPGANYVRLSGADGFSRCLPMKKALHTDTLLAYEMGGERLPASHGFPVRAIVPGWYGMESVKWLRGIDVIESPDPPTGYLRLERSLLTGVRPGDPVREGNVKSAFSRPLEGATLYGRKFTLRGVAWAGENRIKQVEVSVDGAKTWRPARLLSPPRPYAWVQWTFPWVISGPGNHELTVRATDDTGRVQPATRAGNRADAFELNSYQTIQVVVA